MFGFPRRKVNVEKGKKGFQRTVPTAPVPPSVGLRPHGARMTGSPAATSSMESAWDSYQSTIAPVTPESFEKAWSEFESARAVRRGMSDFKFERNAVTTAEKLAATDDGQVVVLAKALELVKERRYDDANLLYDAALEARKKREASGNSSGNVSMGEMLGNLQPDTFDRIETAAEGFYKTLATPFDVAPSGDKPGYTMPFNGTHASKDFQTVAGWVATERGLEDNYSDVIPSKVFSAELRAEAKRLSMSNWVPNDPENPSYAHRDYTNFVRKVLTEQRNNPDLTRRRVTRAHGIAESVARLNKAERPTW
jgi:hypothetical protein